MGLCPVLFKKIVPIIKNQAVNLQINEIMEWQRAYRFLVVLLLMLPGKIFSQQQLPLIAQKSPQSLMISTIFSGNSIGINNMIHPRLKRYKYAGNEVGLKETRSVGPEMPAHFRIIQQNYYTLHVGFFCHKELQFEKLTDVPLRFRLGSLDYVNRMEGKQ